MIKFMIVKEYKFEIIGKNFYILNKLSYTVIFFT